MKPAKPKSSTLAKLGSGSAAGGGSTSARKGSSSSGGVGSGGAAPSKSPASSARVHKKSTAGLPGSADVTSLSTSSADSQVVASGPALNPETPPQVGVSTHIALKIGEGAGSGPLSVNVDCGRLPKPLEIVDHHDMTMTIQFTPVTNGTHVFVIKWGDKPIAGSPFSVTVQGTPQRNPALVAVDSPSVTQQQAAGLKVKTPLVFKVTAPEEAGPGPLLVDAAGPSEPDIRVEFVSMGVFTVSVDVAEAGEYEVGVYWGDEATHHVTGSPFKVEFH